MCKKHSGQRHVRVPPTSPTGDFALARHPGAIGLGGRRQIRFASKQDSQAPLPSLSSCLYHVSPEVFPRPISRAASRFRQRLRRESRTHFALCQKTRRRPARFDVNRSAIETSVAERQDCRGPNIGFRRAVSSSTTLPETARSMPPMPRQLPHQAEHWLASIQFASGINRYARRSRSSAGVLTRSSGMMDVAAGLRSDTSSLRSSRGVPSLRPRVSESGPS
jgi:hypothetical protein